MSNLIFGNSFKGGLQRIFCQIWHSAGNLISGGPFSLQFVLIPWLAIFVYILLLCDCMTCKIPYCWCEIIADLTLKLTKIIGKEIRSFNSIFITFYSHIPSQLSFVVKKILTPKLAGKSIEIRSLRRHTHWGVRTAQVFKVGSMFHILCAEIYVSKHCCKVWNGQWNLNHGPWHCSSKNANTEMTYWWRIQWWIYASQVCRGVSFTDWGHSSPQPYFRNMRSTGWWYL